MMEDVGKLRAGATDVSRHRDVLPHIVYGASAFIPEFSRVADKWKSTEYLTPAELEEAIAWDIQQARSSDRIDVTALHVKRAAGLRFRRGQAEGRADEGGANQ